jgi:exodeoxyribonuclease-3
MSTTIAILSCHLKQLKLAKSSAVFSFYDKIYYIIELLFDFSFPQLISILFSPLRMSPPLSLISWNINGLRAIYKKGLIPILNQLNPDIICFQETKVQQLQIPQNPRPLEHYHAYFAEAEKKGYSGVATYSKIKPVQVKIGFNHQFDQEGRVLMTDFKDFMLFNVYFPNGKSSPARLQYKLDFYHEFLSYLDQFQKQNHSIIICGDVNTAHTEIDLAHPKNNEKISGFLSSERAWIDKLLSKGFIDTLRLFHPAPHLYTWWDLKTKARERNIGWRIDYFFISENFKHRLTDAYILPEIMGSDHCPIGIRIKRKE